MFLFGIITSIFWALTITVILWVLCAFSGRLVDSGFRMSTLQHVLCFMVAVPTVVLLVVVFTCNKLNRLVSKVDDNIVKTMMADGRFVEQINRQIASKGNTKVLTEYISETLSDNISSEYPMLRKYIDTDKLADNLNIGDMVQSVDAGKETIRVMQLASEKFTAGIRSKIKSARRKALIAVILLQAICFGVALYKAGTYHNAASSVMFYESNDYL